MIDNILGMGFGAVRGAFIVSLAFLIMSSVIDIKPEKQPKWLKGSVTKPYLQDGAQVIAKMAPDYLKNFEEIVKKQQDNEKAHKLKGGAEESIDDAAQEAGEAVEGSKSATRRAMDRIMNTGEKYKEDIKDEQR